MTISTMKKLFAALLFTASLTGTLAVLPLATLAASPPCYVFTRNLTVGSSGPDAQALQQFLNAHGAPVAAIGAGSLGNETTLFGGKTKLALAKFQATWKISPAVGYFGPVSRGAIQIICNASSAGNSLPNTGAGDVSTTIIKDPVVVGVIATLTPIVVPVPTLVITTPPPVATTTPPVPAAISITPGSIVGVLCTYDYRGGIQLIKGTGVIVSPQGYVLTARHIIDPKWTRVAYDTTLDANQKDLYDNAILEHCEIGLPENISLPSADDIRNSNPAQLITRNFQYSVQPYFVASASGLSTQEYQQADFAVLKVSGPTPTCTFTDQNCSLNGNFPYTPIANALPNPNSDQILSYGYPVEISINNAGNQFYDFYLKGAVGTVGNYVLGTQRFAGQPMSFSFEAQDIQDGRSGSPLFWNGHVIGILYGSTVGSTQESYNLTMPAIIAMLHDASLDSILATQ
jgi:hypothetical protein